MARVLVVSSDTVGRSMAGPGIRAWEFAQVLAQEHRVTLAAPAPLPAASSELVVIEASRSVLRQAADANDVVLVQGSALDLFPTLVGSRARLVIDLYDPYLIENLEIHSDSPMGVRLAVHDQDLAVLRQQALAGDFFLCASTRQRHLWTGVLAAMNRVNPLTYEDDHSLDRLIAVVPFGLPDRAAHHSGAAFRGVLPGIGADDQVVLWGGGIWNWFDPLTLIRAAEELAATMPQLRVVFMGTRHPNPSVPRMRMAAQAVALSRELGLTGRHVFFNEGWVPYLERENYLTEADVGASLHLHHLETVFSFRTRVLDYLWAGLPLLLTAGDSMADLAERERLGVVVQPGNVGQVADGLRRLLLDPEFRAGCRTRSAAVAERFRWSRVLAPVVSYCREPWRAADASRQGLDTGLESRRRVVRGLLPRKAWHALRHDGMRPFVARSYRYLRRRFK